MNIALIAHDSKKQEMIEFVKKHESFFKQHSLFATGTTGLKIMENTDLKFIAVYLGHMVEISRLEDMWRRKNGFCDFL